MILDSLIVFLIDYVFCREYFEACSRNRRVIIDSSEHLLFRTRDGVHSFVPMGCHFCLLSSFVVSRKKICCSASLNYSSQLRSRFVYNLYSKIANARARLHS